MHKSHYLSFGLMGVLSFISMYTLMYAMVDQFSRVYINFNQAYMAGLMTAPMLIFELALMWSMYKNKAANIAIIAVSLIALVGFFLMIRAQTAIGDVQFLRSMIPHHSGAILMCERAPIQNPEIRELCKTIIESQRSEIDQMTKMLGTIEQ